MCRIQLQRQGVSQNLRGWFAPCPHGHSWHIEFTDYQRKFFVVDLSYPNCHQCFGPVGAVPELSDDFTNEEYYAWEKARAEHRASIRSGQVAWNSWCKVKPVNIGACMNLAQVAFGKFNLRCTFESEIEAYYLYTLHDLRNYPHVANDVFFCTARYCAKEKAILHEPSGSVLVSFDPDSPQWSRPENKKYIKEVVRAKREFLKSHIQREGEDRPRRWFAWLLSEYIKEEHIEELTSAVGLTWHELHEIPHTSEGARHESRDQQV